MLPRGNARALALALALALVAWQAYAQYDFQDEGYGYNAEYGGDVYGVEGDGDEYGYGYDSYGVEADADSTGEYYGSYGYYGDEDQQYYEYYGYYADDEQGYQDYYSDEYEAVEECVIGSESQPMLSNKTASCDVKISGVDKQAKSLEGGLDGVYVLVSCYNGKPMYRRKNSPSGQERVLWYSSTFGDWDISKGTEPDEAEIVMYGGEMEHASAPLFCSQWHLAADAALPVGADADRGDGYTSVKVKMHCADGKVFKPAGAQAEQGGPILTNDEMEAKYRVIYNRYGRSNNNMHVSFFFVVLLVMGGLTTVLAIPYLMMKKKGSKDVSLAASFAQMLQQSRKKNVGRMD